MVNTNISNSFSVLQKGNTDKVDSSALAKTQSNSGSFADLLQKTAQSNSSADKTEQEKAPLNEKQVSAKDKKPQKNVDKVKNIDSSPEADVIQTVQQLLSVFQNQILKVLNISQEQLETALSSMGLNLKDLLQPANLMNLMNQVSETKEPVALLTDSLFAEQWKTLSEFANNTVIQISGELDMSKADFMENLQNNQKNSFSDMLKLPAEKNPENTVTMSDSVSVSEPVKDSLKQPVKILQSDHTENDPNTEQLQAVIKDKLTVSRESGESNTDSGKSFQQTSGEQEAPNHVTVSFSQAVQDSFAHISGETMNPVEVADVVNQIVEAAKMKITPDMTTMDIHLNPENLGKVVLSVIAKDGMITAQLTAENEAVKKAMENQLHVLKDNFNQQGIKVEAVEVSVASHAFDSGDNFQNHSSDQNPEMKKSRHLKLDSLEDLNETELLEDEKKVIHSLGNNSVEYSA